MYEELITRLKEWPRVASQYEGSVDNLHDDAYKAIEDLQKRIPNTAKWEWDKDAIDYNIGSWVCGKCKNAPNTMWQWEKANIPARFSGSHYCPNCGAKMT